jgi:hypothetical protein
MDENSDIQTSSISKGRTVEEIGEFWDTYCLSDYWEQTHEASFDVRAKAAAKVHSRVT